MSWTRDEAIADVLEACDGAFGRVAWPWWLRPVGIKKCEARGCYKRFPVGVNRKYCGSRCREREAKRRKLRRQRHKVERKRGVDNDRRPEESANGIFEE